MDSIVKNLIKIVGGSTDKTQSSSDLGEPAEQDPQVLLP